MEIDVTIEIIDNGFIVSGLDDDGEFFKRFYPTLEEFAMPFIMEELNAREFNIIHQQKPDETFYFKLSSDSLGLKNE